MRVYNAESGVNYSVKVIFDAIGALLLPELRPAYRDDLPGEAQTSLPGIRRERGLRWKPCVGSAKGSSGQSHR